MSPIRRCRSSSWQALDGPVPTFAHLPLLSDATGAALSKRLGSIGISHLRDDEGMEPMAINSLLAKLGTSRRHRSPAVAG